MTQSLWNESKNNSNLLRKNRKFQKIFIEMCATFEKMTNKEFVDVN